MVRIKISGPYRDRSGGHIHTLFVDLVTKPHVTYAIPLDKRRLSLMGPQEIVEFLSLEIERGVNELLERVDGVTITDEQDGDESC